MISGERGRVGCMVEWALRLRRRVEQNLEKDREEYESQIRRESGAAPGLATTGKSLVCDIYSRGTSARLV